MHFELNMAVYVQPDGAGDCFLYLYSDALFNRTFFLNYILRLGYQKPLFQRKFIPHSFAFCWHPCTLFPILLLTLFHISSISSRRTRCSSSF